MKLTLRSLFFFAAIALASFAPSAFADSTVYFNGSYAFGDNGYGIPPYGGTLNGQSSQFYCVDFSHDITAGMSWSAAVTPVTLGGDYSATFLGNSSSPTYAGSNANAGNDYLLFAYILTQMGQTTNQTTQAEDQWAIWSFTDGGYDPYGSANLAWVLSNAESNLSTFSPAGWEILTPDDGTYGQEFMINTPEPASVLLLALGLGALFVLKRRQALQN
ncbi:MAG TPA: PEP-CTERM sorting domain-containing protein [Candidatus Acidoferrales bacterium]|nr:PEP-CTERM sorting domain-containing protein [Candidatus Acidoferrales bacterium]